MRNQQTSYKKSVWKIGGRLFGFGTSPEADWRIILISTIILAVLVLAFSVFLFTKIDKREIFVVEKSEEQREKALDISLLRETVFYYQNKALEFERIKNATSTEAVDPSL